jgi:uncharacterized membrane protein YesL
MKKSDFWSAVGIFIMYLLSLIMIIVSIIGLCVSTNNELLVQSILSLVLGLLAHGCMISLIYFITGE